MNQSPDLSINPERQETPKLKIAICGAGPIGLATALKLAEYWDGWEITIFDPRGFSEIPESRYALKENIYAPTLQGVLQNLGINFPPEQYPLVEHIEVMGDWGLVKVFKRAAIDFIASGRLQVAALDDMRAYLLNEINTKQKSGALSNIELDSREVVDVITGKQVDSVNGIVLEANGVKERILFDLVIDATGPGARVVSSMEKAMKTALEQGEVSNLEILNRISTHEVKTPSSIMSMVITVPESLLAEIGIHDRTLITGPANLHSAFAILPIKQSAGNPLHKDILLLIEGDHELRAPKGNIDKFRAIASQLLAGTQIEQLVSPGIPMNTIRHFVFNKGWWHEINVPGLIAIGDALATYNPLGGLGIVSGSMTLNRLIGSLPKYQQDQLLHISAAEIDSLEAQGIPFETAQQLREHFYRQSGRENSFQSWFRLAMILYYAIDKAVLFRQIR